MAILGGNMNKLQITSILIVALTILSAFYFYPLLPDKMASHWNFSGHVDGYSDKNLGAFFIPILSIALLVLFSIMPKLDPLKKNYASFSKDYDGLVVMLLGFLAYVYFLTLAYALGYSIDMTRFMAPALGALFYYMGIVLSRAKQNWFVGIRTPWTLSSELVWDKTHAICSKLFKVAGIVSLLGVFMPILLLSSVAILLATAILSIVYSYVEFQKEVKNKMAPKNPGQKKRTEKRNRKSK